MNNKQVKKLRKITKGTLNALTHQSLKKRIWYAWHILIGKDII